MYKQLENSIKKKLVSNIKPSRPVGLDTQATRVSYKPFLGTIIVNRYV